MTAPEEERAGFESDELARVTQTTVVAEVHLEERDLVDAADAIDLADHRRERGGRDADVERPTVSTGPTNERAEIPMKFVEHALAYERG